MLQETSSSTYTDLIWERLRSDIVDGIMPAGAKLGMKRLCDHYRTGMTPLREALNRLAGEGFVDFFSQRGFAVSSLSRADLEDIVHLRIALETMALRQAITRGDAAWEANILANFEEYERNAVYKFDPDANARQLYVRAHRGFHEALFNGCISSRTRSLQLNLFDQTQRYWNALDLTIIPAEEIVNEHRDLMEAVLSRDPKMGEKAIERHYTLTTIAFSKRYSNGDPLAG